MLRDVGELVILLAATLTAVGVIIRSRPARWLWHRNITEPMAEQLREVVAEAVSAEFEARPWTNGESTATVKQIRAELGAVRRQVTELTQLVKGDNGT